jgi:hypothetical protein
MEAPKSSRDRRQFRSAVREPVVQARKVLCQADRVASVNSAQDTIHIRVDD